jgi:hypothetical protein
MSRLAASAEISPSQRGVRSEGYSIVIVCSTEAASAIVDIRLAPTIFIWIWIVRRYTAADLSSRVCARRAGPVDSSVYDDWPGRLILQ